MMDEQSKSTDGLKRSVVGCRGERATVAGSYMGTFPSTFATIQREPHCMALCLRRRTGSNDLLLRSSAMSAPRASAADNSGRRQHHALISIVVSLALCVRQEVRTTIN